MDSLYEISDEAQNDLFEIWQRIAADSIDVANRIDEEFHSLFDALARMPGQGHLRKDLTSKPLLFFPIYSYLVVYHPKTTPVRILAVLHGKRDVRRLLRGRQPK